MKRQPSPSKKPWTPSKSPLLTPEELARSRKESAERGERAALRRSLEREARRLRNTIAFSGLGLVGVARGFTLIEMPYLTIPVLLVAGYMWLRYYRRIQAIRAEMARLGVNSDEVELAAENATAPFKFLGLYVAVLVGVGLSLVLLVWAAKRLEGAIGH